MSTAYVGLGANLGDRAAALREAVRRLRSLGRIAAVSGLYETEPVGCREQPRFLNAVVGLETALSPVEFLHALIEIEADLGRERSFPNAPRTLDLDLLLYDDVVLETPELTVPHPRLHERAFVLVPLVQIAPGAIHPVLGQPVSVLITTLQDRHGVDPYATPEWTCVASEA